jgi:hypothetical protein
MEYFPYLPGDIRKRYLLTVLPVVSILKLCSTSTEYRDLCRDPKTWIYLVSRDFGWSPDRVRATRVDPNRILRNQPVGFNPQGLYIILHRGERFSPNRREYLRLLNLTPDISPITNYYPLYQVHSRESNGKFELEYSFRGGKVPQSDLVLTFYWDGWGIHYGYICRIHSTFVIYSQDGGKAISVVLRILESLEDLDLNRTRHSDLAKIIGPIAESLNLTYRGNYSWADGPSKVQVF